MTYEEIKLLLKKQSNNLSHDSLFDVESTLQLILQKFDLKILVDSILSDSNYLKEVASLSYSHSLGFDKIIISPYMNNYYQLRLNIWWKTDSIHTEHYEDIHNHRWDFSTVLLNGSYKYENYRVNKNGSPMFHYFYYPIKNGNYIFDLQGKRNIKLFASGSLQKNEFMSVSNDILHKIIPVINDSPTFTLFLTSKPKVSKTSVYSENLLEKRINNIKIPPMTVEHVRDKLVRLASII